ncbi:uncharacterized protein [Physcomitrium patens]|uniref:Uncharacterized protein n=1 Tax=Physcomitrium patens TaxID=3218 RepID=A0A7I4DE82_PHYPA|nr:uncharacterized protein LOC112279955 isoform X2 [Physcomitrium patens]|eukprot:XP_024370548.1 uncharacterized protein LOC112279955 isoform X2 [Physcomitrella patens]
MPKTVQVPLEARQYTAIERWSSDNPDIQELADFPASVLELLSYKEAAVHGSQEEAMCLQQDKHQPKWISKHLHLVPGNTSLNCNLMVEIGRPQQARQHQMD